MGEANRLFTCNKSGDKIQKTKIKVCHWKVFSSGDIGIFETECASFEI